MHSGCHGYLAFLSKFCEELGTFRERDDPLPSIYDWFFNDIDQPCDALYCLGTFRSQYHSIGKKVLVNILTPVSSFCRRFLAAILAAEGYDGRVLAVGTAFLRMPAWTCGEIRS